MAQSARPSWTINRSAQECGVSPSTIKRRLREGKFPNAVQGAGGAWTIPVQDLVLAGLKPGKPAPPEQKTSLEHPEAEPGHWPRSNKNDLGQGPRSEDLLNRISELEQELKLERTKRESLEILLKERGEHVESLKLAMRMIEPSKEHQASQNDLGQRPKSGEATDLGHDLQSGLPPVPFWKRWKRT